VGVPKGGELPKTESLERNETPRGPMMSGGIGAYQSSLSQEV
jgi:hypothetical protein